MAAKKQTKSGTSRRNSKAPQPTSWRRLAKVPAWGVLLIGIVAGCLLSAGYGRIVHADASSTAKDFIAALNAGDSGKAYALTSANLRGKQSQSQFSTSLGNLRADKPLYTQTATTFSGDTATFTATEDGLPPAYDGKTTGLFTVSLVRSGPLGWRVDSVNVQ